MIPWKSVEKDGFPKPGQRVLAVQANPFIGTEIVSLHGRDLDGSAYHKEEFITHWCPTSEIEIPEGITPVRREP